MNKTVYIGDRFCGPPNSGNGGYSAGIFAKHVGNPAQITLLNPIPLGKPIAVKKMGGKTAFYDGDTLIGTGIPSDENIPVIEMPTPEDIENAEVIGGIIEQPEFNRCFVCGIGRQDGLKLTSRKVVGKDCVVATWIPDASFADEDGFIADELVWAALDCPGGWAIIANRSRLFVLGRIVGELIEKVKPGERYIIAAWQISEDGRKSLAGEAIYTESGMLVAKSKTLWIEPKTKNFFINNHSDALKRHMSF